MTAEASSTVSTGESPQPVVDGAAAHLAQLAGSPARGEAPARASDGPARDGAVPTGPGPDAAARQDPAPQDPAPQDPRQDPTPNGAAPHGVASNGHAPHAPDGGPLGADPPEGAYGEDPAAWFEGAHPEVAALDGVALEVADFVGAEFAAADPDVAALDGLPPGAAGPVEMATADLVAAELAATDSPAVESADAAQPAHFAAAAVLDVLRASGWADTAEAAELRAEANRLRELLDLVVRDHRAREASAAGVENQQLYWLVPLLRAAHGVAFGSLGAKVSLRTAVLEVPPDVLATAGLRIDYGVERDGVPDEHTR